MQLYPKSFGMSSTELHKKSTTFLVVLCSRTVEETIFIDSIFLVFQFVLPCRNALWCVLLGIF